MHTMDNTPKILTIIGLIFEGIGVIGSFVGGWILVNIRNFPGVTANTMEMTPGEFEDTMVLLEWLGEIIYIFAIFLGVIFIINLFIFTKLLRSKFEETSAKKVYLYQAIWGGINILFNQVTGILYLVSGVSGYSGHREEKNIREGI